MTEHDQIRQVLRNYVTSGLIEHDLEKFLSCVSDDIMGYGMGEQGFISSKLQMREIVATSLKSSSNTVYDLRFIHEDVRMHGPDMASVCATIRISATCGDKTTVSGLLQSLTLKCENGTWHICAIHASPIGLSRESIEAYPLRFAENALAQLKTDMLHETFDLLNKSFSGGILSCYNKGNVFPLYFINDSMLAYLGFTREEFVARCGKNVLDFVHPDDKLKIMVRLQTRLPPGADYEVRYRVLRKNGDVLWMLGRGRKVVEENGDTVLINALLDITDMVNMQNVLEEQARVLEEQTQALREQAQALKEQACAIAVSEERFRIALEKTSNIIFDYDIISGNIIHSSAPKKAMDFVTHVEDAPATLVMGGEIMPSSLDVFLTAFERIRAGASQAECEVKVKLITDKEIWCKIAMTGIVDEGGHAVRAIGMIEDITKQKEAEIAYMREEQFRRAVLARSLASYVINFTTGEFESCKVNNPLCRYVQSGDPYDEVMYHSSKSQLGEDDRRAFMNMFSKTHVLEAFESGKTELELEYTLSNDDGTNIWIRSTLRTMRDAVTNYLMGFLYVTDIDAKKRAELELMRKSEEDPLTGIWNKGASETRIREKLETSQDMKTGVFMMLDVDYFKTINDTYGHPFGDEVLSKVGSVLREMFRENDVVGRLGGDEFCVFFSGMRSRKRIEMAADTLCKGIRRIFTLKNGKPGVSCTLGIAMCDGVAKSFEQMYHEADRALYVAKEAGRDGYAFFEKEV